MDKVDILEVDISVGGVKGKLQISENKLSDDCTKGNLMGKCDQKSSPTREDNSQGL